MLSIPGIWADLQLPIGDFLRFHLCDLLCLVLIVIFGLFAMASSSGESDDQGSGTAKATENESNLGDYKVEILSCRLAKSYDDKAVVIVKYKFTNNDDEPANFMFAFKDEVYQDGVGLNHAYVLDDSADYSSDNQTKDIKTGASLEVEVAYELNDETTDIEVEVSQLVSWDEAIVKKTFKIAE